MPDRVPVRLISKGRVTIPKDVRDEYGLSEGDRIWIEVEPVDDGANPYSHAAAVARLGRD